MMKLIRLLSILLFINQSVQATNYYVSLAGNDANSGTSAGSPWKTLNKLNINYALFAAGDSILFNKGDVFYGTLTISGRVGTVGSPIVLASYGSGNMPVLRASQAVTSWTVYSGNIWKATVAKLSKQVWNGSAFVPFYFRTPSLFINNVAQQLGREPAYNTTNGGYRTISSHAGSNLTVYEASALPYSTNQFQGAEVAFRINRDYFKTETVTSHSGNAVNVTSTNPDPTVNTIVDNFGYFFQNHVNTLNTDGEWSHDTATSTLYLYSSTNPNSRTIEVPLYPSALIINNSSYLKVIGLQLEDASDNTLAGQNDDNVTIANCYINNSPLYGTYIFQITNSTFNNNTFVNGNNTAARIELCSGITFTNNTVKNFGMRAGMGDQGYIGYAGVRLVTNSSGNNTLIETNLLDSIGFHGINYGGYGVTVHRNEVKEFCMVKDDGGGIYTSADTFTTKVYENILHDAAGAPFGTPAGSQLKPVGLYLDLGSQKQEAYSNTIYNIGSWGLLLNLSSNNNIHDNTMFNCALTSFCSNTYPNTWGSGGTAISALSNTVKKNIFFPRAASQRCSDLNNTLTPSDLTSNLGTIDSNYYCQPYTSGGEVQVVGSSTNAYTLNQFKLAYPAYESHGFVAPQKLNSSDNPYTNLRLDVNPTSSAVSVNLGGINYVDAKGTTYTGTVTIGAYGSLALIRTSPLVAQTVGAIRWDAWTGAGNSVGQQIERTLGPNQYHYRVPFYGVEVAHDSVNINACTQAIMDQEIQYALQAGLDYWAFVWYPASGGLDQSRKLYKSSKLKQSINYCLVIEAANWVTNISIDSIVNDFKSANYQKVLGNRPLLYLLGYAGIVKSDVDTLRARTIRAGFGTPYIVEMRVDGVTTTLSTLGLDAFSFYATTWVNNGVTYDSLANTDISQWDYTGVSLALKTVPHVTTGWDKRPRHDHNVSWEADPGANAWVQQATADELVFHINEAKNWNMANPTVGNANTVIVYAWNEFDEGGWICPTLTPYGNSDRVKAIGNAFGSKLPPP